MKNYFCLLILSTTLFTGHAQIDVSTTEKFKNLERLQVSSFTDLTGKILSASPSKKEQLQLLLLWSYRHMTADSVRFFQGGSPLTIEEAFKKRVGLCDEFSNMVGAFCNAAGIPTFRVEGYVKYPGFLPGDNFEESNHAWNAVFLDSSWLLCDLFWSITALVSERESEPYFTKRLATAYFLAQPKAFINDHLPSDPVFQFSDHPIAIQAFTSTSNTIDTTIKTMRYLNYQDSLNVLSKMNAEDRALRIVRHSYEYNTSNPNDMIIENYNYAVEVYSKKTATRQELIKARSSLTSILLIIDSSKKEEIRSVKENCKSIAGAIDKRLGK